MSIYQHIPAQPISNVEFRRRLDELQKADMRLAYKNLLEWHEKSKRIGCQANWPYSQCDAATMNKFTWKN